MSEKTRSNTQWKQRRCNSPWRPQAATGLPIQSSEKRGAQAPFNPFAVVQGRHHSLTPVPHFPSPFAFGLSPSAWPRHLVSDPKPSRAKYERNFDRERLEAR
jgi:hypothetical protein